MQLTKSQSEQIIAHMDGILALCGEPTISSTLNNEMSMLNQLPPDQRGQVWEQMKLQVAASIGSMFAQTTEAMRKQMESPQFADIFKDKVIPKDKPDREV